MLRWVSAAPYMVFQFYYGASGVGAATKKIARRYARGLAWGSGVSRSDLSCRAGMGYHVRRAKGGRVLWRLLEGARIGLEEAVDQGMGTRVRRHRSNVD